MSDTRPRPLFVQIVSQVVLSPFEDGTDQTYWIVGAKFAHPDGGEGFMEMANFSGPEAEARAVRYAQTEYQGTAVLHGVTKH